MENLKDQNVISIVSINATLIGIFTALYLAYNIVNFSRIQDLEIDALKTAEKINQIKNKQIRYPAGLSGNPELSSYRNQFLYIYQLSKPEGFRNLNVIGLNKELSNRGGTIIHTLNKIVTNYPFPGYKVKSRKRAEIVMLQQSPVPIFFDNFDELREWDSEMFELLKGYEFLKTLIEAGEFSYKPLDALSNKMDLIEHIYNGKMYTCKDLINILTNDDDIYNRVQHLIKDPRVDFNEMIKSIDIANNIWVETNYRVTLAEGYRNKMSPKPEAFFVLSSFLIIFISGVIFPLIDNSIHKVFYIYFPTIMYVLIFSYVFKIAYRVIG